MARSCGTPSKGLKPRSASPAPTASAAAALNVESRVPKRLASSMRSCGAWTTRVTISHATTTNPTVSAAAAIQVRRSWSCAIAKASTGPAQSSGSADQPRAGDASLRSSVGRTCSTAPLTASGRNPRPTRCTARSTSAEATPASASCGAAATSAIVAASQARSAARK